MASKIRQMDENLARYYQEHGRKDYYDEDQDESGKFEVWCEENGYNEELIEEELNGLLEDCMLLEFDIDDDNKNIFPLNEIFNDENKRNEAIFEILKNIYFRGEWKIYKLDANIIDIDVNESEMLTTYKLYLQHIKTWANDGHKNCNMLHFLAISLQNNLLMNIVDSFRREKLEWFLNDLLKEKIKKNQAVSSIKKSDKNGAKSTEHKNDEDWMQQNQVSPIIKWMATHTFIQDLDLRFKNLKKNYSLNSLHEKILEIEDEKEQKTKRNKANKANKAMIATKHKHTAKDEELSLKSAITTYAKRNGEHLVLNQTHKIEDKIREIATYIVVSGNFIKQLLSEQYKQPPFSVDFMIIFPPLVGDNMDDYKEDVIGNIISDLKKTGRLYHETEISDTVFEKFKVEMDPIPIARTWIQLGLFKFVHKLKNKNKGQYPQYNRLNIIVDRRNMHQKNKKDALIFFDPPNECNSIPKQLHPPELYFDQSRQCLIPRAPYKSFEHRTTNIAMNRRTLDATQVANGQLMTFSFHVRADDDIKCYLLWNGQCVRFYPQDIIDLLPQLFIMNKFGNQKFIDSDNAKQLVSRMEIKDTKFEQFYRSLTNKKPNQFPKKYHWIDEKK